jgi:hypothetical protein
MYLWVHAFGSAPFVMKVPAFVFSLLLLWLTYELGASQLLAALRRRLPEVDRRQFFGLIEPIVVYRFRLPALVDAPAEHGDPRRNGAQRV